MTDGIAICATLLKFDSGITEIVNQGIYPVMFPQMALPPCIVLNIVGGTDEQILAGAGGYYTHRIRAETISRDTSQAISLGTLVRNVLGDVTKATVGTAIDVDIYFDNVDHTDAADERDMARRIQDFCVRWRDA